MFHQTSLRHNVGVGGLGRGLLLVNRNSGDFFFVHEQVFSAGYVCAARYENTTATATTSRTYSFLLGGGEKPCFCLIAQRARPAIAAMGFEKRTACEREAVAQCLWGPQNKQALLPSFSSPALTHPGGGGYYERERRCPIGWPTFLSWWCCARVVTEKLRKLSGFRACATAGTKRGSKGGQPNRRMIMIEKSRVLGAELPVGMTYEKNYSSRKLG